MLASDAFVKLGSVWGDDLKNDALSGWHGLPAHKRSGGMPAGANEVFADGSVHWFNSKQLINLYTPTGDRFFYFFQDDLGQAGAVVNPSMYGP
jgi:hypothetical protein